MWATPAAGGAITSVFGRTGVVVAAASDYSFAQIGAKPTTLAGYGITDAAALSHTHGIDVLSNVTITTPANGQVLTYNSATAKWVNQTSAAGASQWTTSGSNIFYNTAGGNVGIGTTTPAGLLHIEKNTNSAEGVNVINPNTGASAAAVLNLGSSLAANQSMSVYYGGTGNTVSGSLTANILANAGTSGGMNINVVPNAPLNFMTTNTIRMSILGNGNIGIGTTAPTAKLDIKGGYSTPDVNGFSAASTVLNVYSTNTSGAGVGGVLALGGNTGLSTATYPFAFIQGAQQTAGEYGGMLSFWTTSNGGVNGEVNSANYQRMTINKIGNVGIGTINTMDIDYRLFVEKGIRTRKVKVDITAWPDYVFKPNYKLPSLNEVEKYLQSNQHLLDVPSAAEVEKNGIDLGSNQAILLKKVEELTLYLIEQNKKLESQQKEIEALKQKVNNPNK